MSEIIENRGMGWLPDYPDFRDQTIDHDELTQSLQNLGQKDSVKAMLSKVGIAKRAKAVPVSADLRAWFSPIEDQGSLGSCTANAGVGMVEYFEKRAFNKYIDASRLFLYKVTRNFIHSKGDKGAFLRSTMGAWINAALSIDGSGVAMQSNFTTTHWHSFHQAAKIHLANVMDSIKRI